MLVPLRLPPEAVNVTLTPEHTVAEGDTLTDAVGVVGEPTVTDTVLEYAVPQEPLVTLAR